MSDPATDPITHGGPDRGYKVCRCFKCGKQEQCTPRRDFYTLGTDSLGPLHCEDCFRDHMRTHFAEREKGAQS